MTKTRAYGSDAVLLAAFEDQYGVLPDAGDAGGIYKRLSFKSISLGAERPLGYDPLLGTGRNAQDPFYEAVSDTGGLEIPLDSRGAGFWFKGLFGNPQSVDNGDGTYTHIFNAGGDVPSLGLEIGHTALETPLYYRHQGVKLGSLSFDMATSGPANASIDMIAQGEASASIAIDQNPASYVLSRFNNGSGSILMDGKQLASVTQGNFKFSNNLEEIRTIREDGLIDGADETEATADGSVTVRFGSDSTIRDAVANESPVTLSYGFTGAGGASLRFDLPRVFLPRKKSEISGPGGIEMSYDWRGAYDLALGYMLTITLINDIEAY